jgi:hypothetical protein
VPVQVRTTNRFEVLVLTSCSDLQSLAMTAALLAGVPAGVPAVRAHAMH